MRAESYASNMQHAIWRQVQAYLPAYAPFFTPDSSLQGELGLTSLDCVELIIRLENKYRIRIPVPDPELELLKTGRDIVNCLTKHLAIRQLFSGFAFGSN